MCNFDTGFAPPEIVKVRPVVVVSDPSKMHTELATVVLLSTTTPDVIRPWHHKLDVRSLPERLCEEETWAKCDLVNTVAFWRLDRVCRGKNRNTGQRTYVTHLVTPEDFTAIRKALLHIFGLQHLTWPP